VFSEFVKRLPVDVFSFAELVKDEHAGVLRMHILLWAIMTKPCTLLRGTWRSPERYDGHSYLLAARVLLSLRAWQRLF